MHVKREPVEDAHEPTERPMDMSSALHPASYPNDLDPSRHAGIPAPMRTLPYPGYESNFDQRLVNPMGPYPIHPAYSPPSSAELSRQEKLQKELQNYMLQNNIPSNTVLSPQQMGSNVSTPEPERIDAGSTDPNMLKMKTSNGKLAIPELLNTGGVQPLDIVQSLNTHQRAKREFVPDEKKDEGYWTKRVKNNDSARRSRVKRKALEKIMETRLVELQRENIELRHELNALKRRYGLPEDGGKSSSSPSYNYLKSSSPPEKFNLTSKDDELEHQSSASDDSRSLDDSRSGYMRSASALSHSLLDPSRRDRADSFSSCGSANRSPSSNSPNSYPQPNIVRTDKSGALDLTSDFVSRAPTTTTATLNTESHRLYKNPPANSPPMESQPSAISSATGDTQHPSLRTSPDHGQFNDESMRGFPLKCRWKLSSIAPVSKPAADANESYPSCA